MRIWDIPARYLCRKHLLGEHRELHGLWSVLVNGKKGYSRHPETRRWVGKLGALFIRHEELADEMRRRGYNHSSPLDPAMCEGTRQHQDVFLHTIKEQQEILLKKGCECRVRHEEAL